MALEQDLVELGLSPKEVKVYLALLELGQVSAQAIARRSGLVRPTTYVILESLTRKGLVSKVTGPDAKKMLFRAETPEHLEQYLDRQWEQLQRRRHNLNQLLPDLRSLFLKGEEKPRVRLFEGKEGLVNLQSEFVSAGRGPIVGIAPEDEMYALFPPDEYDREIRSQRVRAGISSRHIAVTARDVSPSSQVDAAALRESRYVAARDLPLYASFAVHGSVLSIVSFRGKIIGVLIEHPDIAASFRSLIDYVWEFLGSRAERAEQSATPLTIQAKAVR